MTERVYDGPTGRFLLIPRRSADGQLLGVGSNLTFIDESDLVEAIRESTQQNVSRAGGGRRA